MAVNKRSYSANPNITYSPMFSSSFLGRGGEGVERKEEERMAEGSTA